MNQLIFNWLFSFTHQSSLFDSLTVFAAQDLIWFWVIILLAIAIIFFRRSETWEAVIFSVGATIISWSGSQFLKMLLGTSRPFVNLPVGSTLLTYSGNDAFPSSHATFLFALAAAVYFYNRTLGTISFAVAILVSASRVATGLHWPIDIAGGFFLALVIILLLRYWALKYVRPRSFS